MRKDEIRNDMGASVSRMVATGPQVPVPIPVQPAATANLMADALLSRLSKSGTITLLSPALKVPRAGRISIVKAAVQEQ